MSDDENKNPEEELEETAGEESAEAEPDWGEAMAEAGISEDDDTQDAASGADEGEPDWGEAMAEAGVSEDDNAEEGGNLADGNVKQVSLDELENAGEGDGPELDVILDIPVRISMEVGCTQIPIRSLLQLNQGSVVELDRLAGEPLDVLVNGTLIAHGEVVMVNDKFGIRLTDVVSQSERIQRLR